MTVRWFRRLADIRRSDDAVAADELRVAASAHGCTPVAEAKDRQMVTVAGTVTSVTLRPRVSVPALVADLYDGTRTVSLVWLGRRHIRGIEPGTYLKASGRLCHPREQCTIFNPSYELLTSSPETRHG